MLTKKIILLPENLNLEQHLQNHPPQEKLKVDNLKYILGLISELPAYDHRVFASQKDEVLYVPLNSQLLKAKIRDYQHYLRYLVDVRVLECDKTYMVGMKSKAYRFTEAYQVKIRAEVLTTPKLVQRDPDQLEKDRLAIEKYPHLIRHFEGLEIDQQLAQQYIDKLYEDELHSSDVKLRQKAANRYSTYQTMINHLVEKTGSFRVDQKGHRFHSPLTNLKSELRQFLTFDGEPLIALDLSCSQPYLATVLFSSSFYQSTDKASTINLHDLPKSTQKLLTNKSIVTVINYINSKKSTEIINKENDIIINNSFNTYNNKSNSISINTSPPDLPCTLMCAKDMSNLIEVSRNNWEEYGVSEAISDEVTNYLSCFRAGHFYEYLGAIVERITGRHIKSRNELKLMVCSVLFSSNGENAAVIKTRKDIFEKVFPWISGLFRLLKQDNHASLALLLQTIESEIFLNRIVARITQERPEVPLFSIHDCLATTLEYEGYVRETVIEELQRATGVAPHLKTELWLPEV
jgi:hypothetical protein